MTHMSTLDVVVSCISSCTSSSGVSSSRSIILDSFADSDTATRPLSPITEIPASSSPTDAKASTCKSFEMKDDDKDGIIYQTGIAAGDYSVKIKPFADNKYADYKLPSSAGSHFCISRLFLADRCPGRFHPLHRILQGRLHDCILLGVKLPIRVLIQAKLRINRQIRIIRLRHRNQKSRTYHQNRPNRHFRRADSTTVFCWAVSSAAALTSASVLTSSTTSTFL